ncbi:MAG TPA: hypothetical protein DIU35_10250, partial [Candidatus Latescibacteria bacterium]|nr:hypothetical protein [Candidatus Latescibacterota bacterium]
GFIKIYPVPCISIPRILQNCRHFPADSWNTVRRIRPGEKRLIELLIRTGIQRIIDLDPSHHPSIGQLPSTEESLGPSPNIGDIPANPLVIVELIQGVCLKGEYTSPGPLPAETIRRGEDVKSALRTVQNIYVTVMPGLDEKPVLLFLRRLGRLENISPITTTDIVRPASPKLV